MSGYGWNPSGNGNPNGFYRASPIYQSNSVEEHCIICHHVFHSIEALINHYDNHMREGTFLTSQMIGQNNYVRVQNQVAPQTQRSLAFGGGQNQPIVPQGLPFARDSHTFIQQRQIQPAVNQVQRRQNFAPANMIRPATASVAQPNQPASVPDEIELEFGEEENNNADRSINLDLTLGLH